MPPKLFLQPRDEQILTALFENGLLDTDMIHQRHFSGVSRRRCQQRLTVYQEQGLTRILPLTLWTGAARGIRAPTIHCLTEQGVEMIAALTGRRLHRVSRGDPQPATIHHRLQIVRSKLAIDDACTVSGIAPPQWILEQDRNPSASGQLPPSQRRILYRSFPGPPFSCTCQPDAACRMTVPRDTKKAAAETTDLVGFFEIDRSTEGRKQIVGKLPGYARVIAERSFQRYFAESESAVVRVFWICETRERIESLCEKLKSESVASYFRFTTASNLTNKSPIVDPIWYATDGKYREIVRLPKEQ